MKNRGPLVALLDESMREGRHAGRVQLLGTLMIKPQRKEDAGKETNQRPKESVLRC